MRTAARNKNLEQFVEELARHARPGERLPTVRALMQRFGASQALVQRALERLKNQGLIDSQVGRGTFFREPDASAVAAPTTAHPQAGIAAAEQGVRSILLLRRSISIARGRVLAEGLQQRFSADGHKVLEVSYNDPDHARAVLKGLPRFDACVVQSTFRTIPIDLLAALKAKCEVLAVDGAALVGADVEAVGTEWGEPLAAAISMLRAHGHVSIAFAITSLPFLAVQLAQRRFDGLRNALPGVDLQAITVPLTPDQDYAETLAGTLRTSLDTAGRLPFTALICWGVEDGAKLRRLLGEMKLEVPASLSVVLLGRTDLVNEHAEFFDMYGASVADQIDTLHAAIHARWAEPSAPYGVRLTPVTRREGQSVSAPPHATPARRSQR